MRAMPIVISCLMASAAYGEGGRPVVPTEPATLTAREVTRYIQPYRDQIRGCYLASASGGSLELGLVIHRDGSVSQLTLGMPKNLAPRAARSIDRCIRALSMQWHFPARAAFTTVTVPFRFAETLAAA
jgi:hypothetical protein